MLELSNIWKTFNAGTINEKQALRGVSLTPPRRGLCHRHRRQRRRQVHHAQRRGRRLVRGCGSITIDGTDVTRLPEFKRAPFIGPGVPGPHDGHRPHHADRGKSGAGGPPRPAPGLKWGHHPGRAGNDYRELLRGLDLGLEDRLTSKVGLLSGGQRQALTLLMAALKKPKLLLLDEHTAALDPKTAAKVLALRDRIVEENHLTTMMVTHNMKDAIAHGNRLIMMYDGQIVIDVSGEDKKKKLTVPDLLALFSKVSGSDEADDKLLLS